MGRRLDGVLVTAERVSALVGSLWAVGRAVVQRIRDGRKLYADDDAADLRCLAPVGPGRCERMRGHVGPHQFGEHTR